MAGCRIVDAAVVSAVSAIDSALTSYKRSGEALISALNSAISSMEGASKDALKRFIDTTVNDYVVTSLPNAVDGMSKLLEANRTNFVDVDQQLADGIGG